MAFRRPHAVLFDFDGIWFQLGSGWIIKDIRLGPIGSRIPWEEGCRRWEALRRRHPSLKISDCFNPSQYEWPSISVDTGLHITPPEAILQTAQRHLSQHNDLFVISCSQHRDLLMVTDTWFPEKHSYPLITNPFKQARFLSLPIDGKANIPRLAGQQARLKLKALEPMFRYRPDRQEFEPCPKGYNKIFIYYSQLEYREEIESFLEQKESLLADGRMALVSSCMARAIL